MNRKANRAVPVWWLFALAIIIIGVGTTVSVTRSFLLNPYRGIPDLPVDQYVDNSLSFRGNTYKVTGRVENQLGWSDKVGRLFSFEIGPDDKASHLGILLPPNLGDVNIQKGQSFQIEVKVADKGLLQAIHIEKS